MSEQSGSDFFYLGRQQPRVPERGGRLPVALAFPGPERFAMSGLGWQAVYRMLATRPDFAVERFFLEDTHGAGPVSADSDAPLSDFPCIALSLTFEEEFAAVLRALEAAGVPVRSVDRPDWPLVLAGGPLAWLNPTPIAPCVDLFWVGEAEAGLVEIMERMRHAALAGRPKQEFLSEVAAEPGVWVPGVSPTPVRRAIAGGGRRLDDPAYSCFISGKAEFADMLLLEVNRGCPYGCRFCAAGFIYRPPRHAELEDLKAIVQAANPPKVGLVGTALTDWPQLMDFLSWLKERGTKFSLSSIRADGVTPDFLKFLRHSGLRTITLALEAPSRRLRKAANKRLREEDFLNAVRLCSEYTVNHLKIYCIVGWPGETDEDYEELGRFLVDIQRAREEGKGKRSKGLELITLSLSQLVPKPWTPFQWAPMATEEQLDAVVARIKVMAKPLRGLKISADSPFGARLQGYLSRSGPEVFDFLLAAARLGGWRKALRETGADFSSVLDHERGEHEAFPWEVVDPGVGREHLWREWQRYKEERNTPPCPPEGCERCKLCGVFSTTP
ncbi:Fe-S oxidoreductase [Desulfocurvibacter africanus PCS]|uniref:Fe-S oxidoreductase n=1 Tax=Desulfocurvibacter africanus PCS TaxID=1262666 RepID=M5PRG5_DESAF|nr:radical SAM protein [Desulfocurvibacter africanus]EMG36660.1 Fe-S oxidoreductase [Desulfocurvibacter africanus PCS]